MNSDRVRKDSFKAGNALTFNVAREMAKSEELAEKQLQLMNSSIKGHQGPQNQRQNPNTGSGKLQACRNFGWGPHSRDQYPAKNATCHYCHKVGHLAKVCLSKLKKTDVRDIEATSIGASESVPDPTDHMFLGPISVTPLTSSDHAISCKEKALLVHVFSLALSPEGRQARVLCTLVQKPTSYPHPCTISLALES